MKRQAMVVALVIAVLPTGIAAAQPDPRTTTVRAVIADFDGDGISDVSVVSTSGNWSFLPTDESARHGFSWGNGYKPRPTDQLAPGDYDGDRRTDPGVFIPEEGKWQVSSSFGFPIKTIRLGALGDRAVPGDYNGDGLTDAAVFRPSAGTWLILPSGEPSSYTVAFGADGDVAAPGDYDGDGKTDLGIFRPRQATWIVLRSSDGDTTNEQFGQYTDILTPGDYDGDGRTDLAVMRPSTKEWWIRRSHDATVEVRDVGGGQDHLPVPADYNGDGRTEVATYSPSENSWFIEGAPNAIWFGRPGDVPVPAAYLPR